MADTMQYKCPCCGGGLEFNTDAQTVKCPYCDTEFDMDVLKGYDEDLKDNDAASDDMTWQHPDSQWTDSELNGMKVYHCTSCGADVVCDEDTSATSCPYCGNPVVINGNLTGDLKPDYVIPFKLDKEAAKKAFAQHLCGKKLLPKVFKDQAHIDEIKGMYVPYWIFDGNTQADILYRGTKVRMWSDAKNTYTETSHYAISRAGSLGFLKVPSDASSEMEDSMMESLEPYDFSQAQDFQSAYLAGYLADRYDVSAEECEPRITERVKNTTAQMFAGTVSGYNSVEVQNSNINLADSRVYYALYPVWLMNTTWNGQQYTFAMNGQTGKFVGDLPMDKGAYRKHWFLTFVLSAAATFGVLYLTAFM